MSKCDYDCIYIYNIYIDDIDVLIFPSFNDWFTLFYRSYISCLSLSQRVPTCKNTSAGEMRRKKHCAQVARKGRRRFGRNLGDTPYPFSHNHGSGNYPERKLILEVHPFSTFMILGERVRFVYFPWKVTPLNFNSEFSIEKLPKPNRKVFQLQFFRGKLAVKL